MLDSGTPSSCSSAEPFASGPPAVPAGRSDETRRKGNRCGHDPLRPRLTPAGVKRPTEPFLGKAWDRLEALYMLRKNHKWWRQHFAAMLAPPPRGRRSARKRGGRGDPHADYEFRRSELLEALVLLLRVLVARHDGRTMRVCREAPDDDDQVVGLPIAWLAQACDISDDRIDRALEALKSAGFELWRKSGTDRRVPCQPREWVEDRRDNYGNIVPGHWRAWPAVRVLDSTLFRALGLAVEHSLWRERKSKEWNEARRARRPEQQPNHHRSRPPRRGSSEPRTLAEIISSSAVLKRPGSGASGGLAAPREHGRGNQDGERVRTQAFAEIRSRLYRRLAAQHPEWRHDQLRTELVRLLE